MTTDDQARRARTLLADARKFGLDLPPAVAKADKETRRALETIAAMEHAASDQALIPAATDALTSGRDPLEAAEVLRAVAARAITGSVNYPMVKASAAAPLHEALVANGDELVAAMRPAFDEAAAAIAEAREHLGGVDLNDAPAVLALGGQAADAHRRVTEAERVILDAAALLRQHGRLSGDKTPSEYHLLRWAEADHDQWKAHARNGRPYTVALAGVALSLPTPAEFADRVTRLEADAAEVAAARVGYAAGGIAVRTH